MDGRNSTQNQLIQACILQALEASQSLVGPGARQASLFNLERYNSKQMLVQGDTLQSFWFKAGQENIVTSSMRWTWALTGPKAKGANAQRQWLPLKDDLAFRTVLMKSIRDAASSNSLSGSEIILISMAQPKSPMDHVHLVRSVDHSVDVIKRSQNLHSHGCSRLRQE